MMTRSPFSKLPHAGFVALVFALTSTDAAHSADVTVPDLVGRSAQEARQALEAAGLAARFQVGKNAATAAEAFQVYSTAPAAGVKVAANSEVVLTIYGGAATPAPTSDKPGPQQPLDTAPLPSLAAVVYRNLPGEHQTRADARDGLHRASIVDFIVPAGPVELRLARQFHGGLRVPGPLGPGWSFNWDRALIHAGAGLALVSGEGLTPLRFDPSSQRYRSAAGDQLLFVDGQAICLRAGGGLEQFDAEGRFTATDDGRGNRVNLKYDELQRLARIEGPANAFLQFTYGKDGRLEKVATSSGDAATYRYDDASLSTEEASRACRYRYDAAGNLIRLAHPRYGAEACEYHAGGLLARRVWDDGSSQRFEYDDAHHARRQIDAKGRTITTRWTPDGRGLLVTDASGRRCTAAYDGAGRLVAVVEAGGKRATFEYDEFGRLLSATSPSKGKLAWEYLGSAMEPAVEIDATGERKVLEKVAAAPAAQPKPAEQPKPAAPQATPRTAPGTRRPAATARPATPPSAAAPATPAIDFAELRSAAERRRAAQRAMIDELVPIGGALIEPNIEVAWNDSSQDSVEPSPNLAWLGAMSFPLSIDERAGLKIGQEVTGAVLVGVFPKSPAAKAGLRTGDEIVSVDGKPVKSLADVEQAISVKAPGEKCAVVLVRDAKRLKSEVLAAAQPLDTTIGMYQLAEQGLAWAQYELAVELLTGQGVVPDAAQARTWMQKAAESRFAAAEMGLGHMLLDGIGGDADAKLGREWLEKAAKRGLVEAQYELASLLIEGRALDPDYIEAGKWMRIAAESGHPRAQFRFGCLCEKIEPPDHAQALAWLKKADAAGVIEANAKIGILYLNGWGVEKNEAAAFLHVLKAAQAGDAESQFTAAAMCRDGIGVTPNDELAVSLLMLAVEQNEPQAENELALRYLSGRGVTPDPAKAAILFRLAAELGNSVSAYNLGLLAAQAKNLDEALGWYRAAAVRGLAEAQFKVGVMYANGEGVEKDPEEALAWHKLAAAQGHAEAQASVRQLASIVKPPIRTPAK